MSPVRFQKTHPRKPGLFATVGRSLYYTAATGDSMNNDAGGPAYPQLQASNFEGEVGGKPTRLFTLRNSRGMNVSFSNLGGKILQIVVPDRNGRMDDVALGYDTIQGVIGGQASMGAFVGRFANRIGKGRFTLDGVAYALEPNNNGNSLHGGPMGS